jgi:hypothetical protein
MDKAKFTSAEGYVCAFDLSQTASTYTEVGSLFISRAKSVPYLQKGLDSQTSQLAKVEV